MGHLLFEIYNLFNSSMAPASTPCSYKEMWVCLSVVFLKQKSHINIPNLYFSVFALKKIKRGIILLTFTDQIDHSRKCHNIPKLKTKAMLMQNFGVTKKRALWYVMVFSGVVNTRPKWSKQ